MCEQLSTKVADWLAKEGYVLEYRTHQAFGKAGLKATMGHYLDGPAGNQREIDVTALVQASDPNVSTIIRILCECKYSSEKPWVLLDSGLRANVFSDWHSLPQSANLRAKAAYIEGFARWLVESWHFSLDRTFAHSLVQVFRSGNHDVAYDALKKIANAAWDWADHPARSDANVCLIAIPALVVDAPLFSARYAADEGRFIVDEVSMGRLSWSGCRGGTVVDVVSARALDEYAEAVKKTCSQLIKVAPALLTR
jgi:hypothetical protein